MSGKTIVILSESDAIHEIIEFLTKQADTDDLAMIVSEYVRNGNIVVMDKNGWESAVSCDGYAEDDDDETDDEIPVITPQADLFEGDFQESDDVMFFNQELSDK